MEMIAYADVFGNKPEKKSDRPKLYHVNLTDEEVLECRALWERGGWTKERLMGRYPQVDRHYLSKLLRYEVRSSLIPAYYNKR